MAPNPNPSPINGRWESVARRLSVADEIEKELDKSLVRAERLRGSVFPTTKWGGMLKSAACPASMAMRD